MSEIALAVLIGSLLLLGVWAGKERQLRRDAEERRIREWCDLRADKVAAGIAMTEDAMKQREELFRTWTTLR